MHVIEGEARTRILWGEEPSVVIGFLSSNGCPVERAEELVRGFLELRHGFVRRRGVRRMLFGGTMFVVLFGILAVVVPTGIHDVVDFPEGFAGLVIGLVFCLWKFIDGLRDFFRPNGAKGDVGFHGEEM